MGWLFAGGALLVFAGWIGYRRRIAAIRAQRLLSDDMIRAIENAGRVEVDEPLDLEEAAEEEDRFWSESWDEPEPYG